MKIKEVFNKLFKKREVIPVFKPFGRIESAAICKYVLNELIEGVEKQREELVYDMINTNLNDKNSVLYLGEIKAVTQVLEGVRNLLKEYDGI